MLLHARRRSFLSFLREPEGLPPSQFRRWRALSRVFSGGNTLSPVARARHRWFHREMTSESDRPFRWSHFGQVVRSPRQMIRTDAARAGMLAAGSLVAGGVLNGFRAQPLPWTYRSPDIRLHAVVAGLATAADPAKSVAVTPAGSFEIIDLEKFQSFCSKGEGIVIDARAAAFYRQGHVPGALSLPRETFAADYIRQKSRLETSRTKEIVVYCSESDCPDAAMVANALSQLGFERLRIYQEGWEEWFRAGLPQEAETTP